MPRMLGRISDGRRAVVRRLRGDKVRLVERIRTLEIERNEAIGAEQQCRSVVRRLTDSGSSRYVRLLEALDDHPEIDTMAATDDEVITTVRALVAESALARGWEACATSGGGLEWRRIDDSGSVVRMVRHPITPAGGVVVGDVLEAATN